MSIISIELITDKIEKHIFDKLNDDLDDEIIEKIENDIEKIENDKNFHFKVLYRDVYSNEKEVIIFYRFKLFGSYNTLTEFEKYIKKTFNVYSYEINI